MREWIVSNLANIKDIFWIVFTLVTTVVAVLTYRRAKSTLLQPLRSEVIKRQTDNLVSLLDFLDSKDKNINVVIDYIGIIYCNIYMFTEACGFFTEVRDMSDEEFQNNMKNQIAGMIKIKQKDSLMSFDIPGPFDFQPKQTEEEKKQIQHERRILYKNGIFDNEYLLLTKEYRDFIVKLESFISNPFTPTKIIKVLEELKKDIYYNIKTPLQEEVKCFMQEMCDRASRLKENKPIQFEPLRVANAFYKKSKSHNESVKLLRKYIREYLMVDKKLY
ncbi:MAG: hypothetical protein IKP72_11685 [Clostridia bacterium]|nr:hypothetical protein [Clostridia bacterium]